jgi:hypothetical protein
MVYVPLSQLSKQHSSQYQKQNISFSEQVWTIFKFDINIEQHYFLHLKWQEYLKGIWVEEWR